MKASHSELEEHGEAETTRELVSKLATFKARHSQVADAAKQQSAEQARRIARIFAQKFS